MQSSTTRSPIATSSHPRIVRDHEQGHAAFAVAFPERPSGDRLQFGSVALTFLDASGFREHVLRACGGQPRR